MYRPVYANFDITTAIINVEIVQTGFFKILKSFSTSGNYLRLMLKILFKIMLKPPTFMLTI